MDCARDITIPTTSHIAEARSGKNERGMSMVKLIVCARRKAGITHDEFGRYWRENHGPLVKSVPEFIRHVRRYVQCHIVSHAVPLGASADYDGVAELWFDSVEELNRAFTEPRYLEIIRPDELKFADLATCVSLVTEEVPIHG
jgi:uncharacterized protein (TIGR02118 family)